MALYNFWLALGMAKRNLIKSVTTSLISGEQRGEWTRKTKVFLYFFYTPTNPCNIPVFLLLYTI